MGRRLRGQDEGPGARLGDREGVVDRPSPGRGNGQMGTRRKALAATNAVLLDDLDHPRLRREGDRIGRADPDTRQATDTPRGVDREVH